MTRRGSQRRRTRGRPGKEGMALFRKQWTPEAAEEWTREDTVAIILSPLIYIMLMLGVGLSIMLMWIGYIILAAAIVLLVILVRIINPKLSAVSEGYEKKQKAYIEELERTVKWEQ